MELTRGKTAILIVMLAGSCYYGYSKYKTVTPGPAINNGHNDEFTRGSRDRTPDGDKRRDDFMASLNLTPEQKSAMAALRDAPRPEGGEGRDRFTSFSQILTPAQLSQMQAARDARRDKGAKASLNSADFAKYKEKQAARRASGGGRGPGGPGGPRR